MAEKGRSGQTPGRAPRGKGPEPIAYLEEEDCLVNLSGDYQYLSDGYYRSQDLESEGRRVRPTCREILDAYVVPLLLEKAGQARLPVPEYYITNDYFDPPAVVDTINPFMLRQSVVLKEGHQERVARSLTRNYTYAVCCQTLPPGARIGYFRAVLGWSQSPRYRPLAQAIWQVFHLPLARVRVVQPDSGPALLSALRPLDPASLTPGERGQIARVVRWPA